MGRVIGFATLLAVALIDISHQQVDKVSPDDVGAKSIKEFFAGRDKFELGNNLKPVMTKKVYVKVDDMKSYNDYVKRGSLKFDRITFFGRLYNGSFTAGHDKTHAEVDEEGKELRKNVYHSVGRFELRLDTFQAQVSWTPPKGSNRTCEIVGLSKCSNGLLENPTESNVLRIFYDNAIILHPWVQVTQNAFTENSDHKTLEFKSYMKFCSQEVDSRERRNVTAGIDHLFLKQQIKTVLVRELNRQYQEVLLDVRDKIEGQS